MILDHNFKMLSLTLSHQHQLFATPQLTQPMFSLSQLLFLKGRLSPSTLHSHLRIYSQQSKDCVSSTQPSPLSMTLRPRITFSSTGSLMTIGFEGKPVWGEYERCVAQKISQSQTHLVTDRPTLLIGDLSL